MNRFYSVCVGFFSFFLLLPSFSFALSPEDQKAFTYLQTQLRGRGDHVYRELDRKAQPEKTVSLKSAISREMDFDIACRILTDPTRYKDWILPGINNRPQGGEYYVKFKDITVPDIQNLIFHVQLDFPLFKRESAHPFKIKTEKEKNVCRVFLNSEAQENDVLKSLSGNLRAFRAEKDNGRIWVLVQGEMSVRPWLLYQALPLRIVRREYVNRLELFLRNLQKEEEKFQL